jgi:sucrose phosphorylase
MVGRETQYVRRSILERLLLLYREQDAHRAYADILDLLDKYQRRVSSVPYRMSERDAILILYGDQVVRPQEPPLATMDAFLTRFLGDAVNTLHILPFFPSSSDDGFSVVDYKEVSPRMGTWQHVSTLANRYRLMVDGVINHVSQHSFWFKGYLRGMREFKDFFIRVPPGTDLGQVVRTRTSPLVNRYEDEDSGTHDLWTTFSRDQVDLNYANYLVLLAVLDVLLFYVWKGARLIRLDAIAFIWKKPGTSCVHLPETHELVQLIREVIHKVAPEVVLITETNVPHTENLSYFGRGDDEAQMVYNFALPPLLAHGILTGQATKLTRWASTLELPSNQVCFFNFSASHDGIGLRPATGLLEPEEVDLLVRTAQQHGGLVSYYGHRDGPRTPYELNCSYMDLLTPPESSDDDRVARLLVSQAVVLAMPGVPGLYFHALVGSRNHLAGYQATGENRSINRERFGLDRLADELERPGCLRHTVFTRCRALLQVRRRERAFDPFGAFSFPALHSSVFAIARTAAQGGSRVLALHNLRGESVTVPIPDGFRGPTQDLTTGALHQGDLATLGPYQVAWLKVVEEKPT